MGRRNPEAPRRRSRPVDLAGCGDPALGDRGVGIIGGIVGGISGGKKCDFIGLGGRSSRREA